MFLWKKKAIEIQNLTKIYPNNRGIFDISIDVEEGDIFGFLGPNGSGKTTAMKIMTGMMKPDKGDVKILGHSITEDFEKAMEKVGCIVETAESYPYLSAFENLKQISRFYNDIDDTRIDEVLKMTQIFNFKNEKVKNFSLGMKQRLGISSAILSNPKIVILDEPLNGLDVEGMIDIRNILKDLASKEHVTFLISSHLIHDVELTCNKIGIIFNGKMISTNRMDYILEKHSSLEDYFISEVGTDAAI